MGDSDVNATELFSRLTARGIRLRTVAGEIQVNRLCDIHADEREQLRRHKTELLALLRGGDVLDPAERQRLMTETVERLSRQYTGWPINWPEVDRINARIGKTFTRRDLVPLLAEYTAAILTGGPAA